ncbi:MAG: hypothetical protein AABM30_09275 [Actinomycetota bacterium]
MPKNGLVDGAERLLIIDELREAGYEADLRAAGYGDELAAINEEQRTATANASSPYAWNLDHVAINGKGRGGNRYLQKKRNALAAFFYADGCTQQEIAGFLDLSQGQVSRILSAGR